MRDPSLVEGATLVPGHCFVCGTVEGRMVDTAVDVVGDGRVYVCERICVPAFGRLLGYLPPEEAARLGGDLDDAVVRVAELEAELAEEKDRKTISLSELRDYVKVDEPARCTALKKDGSRCAGRPVPGWDTCVAHSRKPAAVAA